MMQALGDKRIPFDIITTPWKCIFSYDGNEYPVKVTGIYPIRRKRMKSYKTTGAAIAALIVAAAAVISAYVDGDPETVPNWSVAIGIAVASIGLFFARDNDKSSEDVGAKKKP